MSITNNRMAQLERASREAYIEAGRACAVWAPFNSIHEGYSVILEELDELWAECKTKTPDKSALRIEAIQLAAMAIRFAAELT
jgi:hypothetical protein